MGPAINVEAMEFGLKCIADLFHRSAEGDPVASPRNARYLKALRIEPLLHFVYIFGTCSEAISEFLGSKPAMVLRGGRILLFTQELLEGRLLLRRRPKGECDGWKNLRRIDRPKILAKSNARVHVT